MKRANILRLVAILAVVVLASMTTGCLKATITGKIQPDPLELTSEAAIQGTLTLTMTGWLAGGMYEKLDVEFFKDGTDDPIAELTNLPINLLITPLNKVASVKLQDIEGLAAPVDLWESDVLEATDAVFTVKPGAGYGLSPIVIEVEVTEPQG
ncbi:MAG TPA: hypothetical protein PLM74_01420 [Bacillota bacterium]|jgi:hypothetical protein|nr:hypothetical protein [Bacillota bacterium]